MKIIDTNNVLLFHCKIVAKTGGSDGIRDVGLIDLGLRTAEGKMNEDDIFDWIKNHKI